MEVAMIGVFIPIVAIVFGIGIGALAIWSDHKRKAQLLEQIHKERMLALEKGVDPPPVAPGLVGFVEGAKPLKPNRYPMDPALFWIHALRGGVALLILGIVLYFALVAVGAGDAALFGLIPSGFGVANLIYAIVLRQHGRERPPTQS
jgi:hypothetical protein